MKCIWLCMTRMYEVLMYYVLSIKQMYVHKQILNTLDMSHWNKTQPNDIAQNVIYIYIYIYISYVAEPIINLSLHFYIIRENLLYQQKETS